MRLATFRLAPCSLAALLLSPLASAQQLLLHIEDLSAVSKNRVASLGDLNADGHSEFIIGLPFDNTAGSSVGRVEVYSGASGDVIYEVLGQGSDKWFGFAVASAGDVNGDGTPDFIVGAPASASFRGRARVYSGSSGAVLLTINSAVDNASLGWSVGTIGDLDGDGRDDPFAGAPKQSSSEGFLTVVSGQNGSSLLEIDGQAYFQRLGEFAVGPGDCNGDGIPDILIGSPGFKVDGEIKGAVQLYSGTGSSIPLATFVGEDQVIGVHLDAGHDWNGDGADDFLIASDSGEVVRVYSGLDQAVLWELYEPGAITPWTVSFVGDVEGDGHAEIVIGRSQAVSGGLISVYSGAEGCELYQQPAGLMDGKALLVGGTGDVDADGRADWFAMGLDPIPAGMTHLDVFGSRGPIGQAICAPAQPNSTGLPGTLRAVGSGLPGDNDVVLLAGQLPVNQAALLLVSPSSGFTPNPGGSQGDLCLAGPIGRYTSDLQITGAAGSTSFDLDLAQTPTPAGSIAILSGQTWYWQTWYRDQNPGSTSNFTSAVMASFQ